MFVPAALVCCCVPTVGADLNRDFPSPFMVCKGQQPDSCDPKLLSLRSNPGVQPETAAIMAWSSNDSFPFTASANLHEGAIVVSTPSLHRAAFLSHLKRPACWLQQHSQTCQQTGL